MKLYSTGNWLFSNTGLADPGVLLGVNGACGVNGTLVGNASGDDNDCYISGDTEQYLFYTDAGNDRVGVLTNTPSFAFDCHGDGRFYNDSANLRLVSQGVGTQVVQYLTTADQQWNIKVAGGANGNFSFVDGTYNKFPFAIEANSTGRWRHYTSGNCACTNVAASIADLGSVHNIYQANATGTLPVLALQQDDVDQPYIDFLAGTIYTGMSGQNEYIKVNTTSGVRYLRLFA